MIFWTVVLAMSLAIGLYLGMQEHRRAVGGTSSAVGWVYFLSPFGGAVEEPPAAIKIGMTNRDPYEERLPEIETMSPKPLEILHTIRTGNPKALERRIHEELSYCRLHGEWFEREPVMAFLDHLKGDL